MTTPSSFWQSQSPELDISPVLVGDIDVDIAIIGAGFTGLSAARELLKNEPTLRIAILEAQYVGYGASGRNGGFNMSLFGLEPEITLLRWGKQKTKDAQHYMSKSVSYVRALVDEYNIESDYEHTGMLRTAYSDRQLKRLEHSLELFETLGVAQNYQYMDKAEVQNSVHSPRFRAAVFEKNSGILNPFKHVIALKNIAKKAGAEIYEDTPVRQIKRHGDKIKLTTPNGTVTSEKLLIAVNAWSGQIKGLPKIRSRQAPVWTSQIVTQPLSQKQWNDIGWQARQSIEDNRQLIHYFRRTACGRFTMGGGNVAFPRQSNLGQMQTDKIWENLESHIKWLFPVLKDIKIQYRWGGPVSVNMDMTPEIGFIGDERVVYANGCIGHGVSLTQHNGKTIAELMLEQKTELTDFWIINRKAIPWPPSILGYAAKHMVKGGLKLWDKFDERGMGKPL